MYHLNVYRLVLKKQKFSLALGLMLVTPMVIALGVKLITSTVTISENHGSLLLSVGTNDTLCQLVDGCSVNFTTVDGSARADEDYSAVSGKLSWQNGESGSKTISINIIDNTENDDSRVFNLILSDAIGITGSSFTATITIEDDEVDNNDSPIRGTLQDFAPTAPAAEVSAVIETVCPQEIAASDLQRDCNTLVGAALGGDANTGDALLQITPDDASTPVDASQSSIAAQTKNINARLATLRRGASGISLSGLNFDIDGNYIPGSFLSGLYDSVGGGASSDALGFSRFGFFISGNISYGDKEGTANEDGFEFDTQGITIGVDYRFTDRFILGGALGYSTTDTDIDANGGKLETDGFIGTLFGTYYSSDRIYIDGSISYGDNDYEQERRVSYSLSNSASVDQAWFADYSG